MANESHLRVSNAPSKPLLVWDGECHFCGLWIERWKAITGDQIEYTTFQESADRFPEISRAQFQRSVILVEPDGKLFSGAAAVYRSLGYQRSRKWLRWSYDHVPGFAAISEFVYSSIARHRQLASAVTRILWGGNVRPPTYLWSRRWFLRLLGLIYLIAFVSLWVQIDGLIGETGILPISQFLPAVRQAIGGRAFALLPTLCWFDASNLFLHVLCGSGALFSLLLMFGLAPAFSLLVLFILYLSLTIAGQTFLSFQWDILLLEAGFLAVFFAPWQLWSGRGHDPPVSRAGLFLLKLLLFKLMLMSGVVKLTSGDDCWWNLTALDYHYWSQPLPTIFAWWADQHPEWFKQFSVALCLVVETVIPFFIWPPRRLRLIACGLLVFLQLAIALTGNYCFFNLLTIALCLLLIDDAVVASLFRRARSANESLTGTGQPRNRCHKWAKYAAIGVIIITLPMNAFHIWNAFKPEAEAPSGLETISQYLQPFRIANGYGLFRVMTNDRREILIEGSADGIEWHLYEFKWKPGDLKRAPAWCAPHQPRLDWQMWFAALSAPQQNPWFVRLVVCLLQGRRDVADLFERNPFPDAPPRYVRARFYRYRFTTAEERARSGAWWKRTELGEYLSEISADQIRQ